MALRECFNYERFHLKRFVTNPTDKEYCVPLDHIIRDLNKGLNVVIIFVGRQGSGKSYLSFLWAWLFNKYYYNHKPALTLKDVHWNIEGFCQAMLKTREKFLVLEETSLSLSSKEWFSDTNKIFNKIIDIFRISGVSICMNLPYIFDLDKSCRLKANYIFSSKKKSKNRIQSSFHKKYTYEDTSKAYYSEIGVIDHIPMITKGEFDYKGYEDIKRGFNDEKYKEFADKLDKTKKKNKTVIKRPIYKVKLSKPVF